MASAETYKVKLSLKYDFQGPKKALLTEHDTAVALLQAHLDLKKKEALLERSKALNVGHELSNTNHKSNKLQADISIEGVTAVLPPSGMPGCWRGCRHRRAARL
jgi:hypothetical protein